MQSWLKKLSPKVLVKHFKLKMNKKFASINSLEKNKNVKSLSALVFCFVLQKVSLMKLPKV